MKIEYTLHETGQARFTIDGELVGWMSPERWFDDIQWFMQVACDYTTKAERARVINIIDDLRESIKESE
jgi:hypothetical protein